MRVSISRREQVVVSYAVLFAALATPLFIGAREAVTGRTSFIAQIGELRSVRAESLQSIESSHATREAIARADAQTRSETAFLQAETDALAAAELQNVIKAIVGAENGTLVSSVFRRETEPRPVTPVPVVVRLRCSVEALARVIYTLDHRTPSLFVEDISIQSRHRPGRPLQDVNAELDVEFTVTGYLNRPLSP